MKNSPSNLLLWACVLTLPLPGALARAEFNNFRVGSEAEPGFNEPITESSPGLIPAPARRPGPFSAGSWVFQTYGSAAFGDENGEMYSGHFGVGYYVWDNLSINLEAFGGHFDFEDGSVNEAAVLGLELFLRHHILRRDNWSLFAELGGGIQQSSEPIPFNGTHFNFRPQAGIGITLNVTERTMLMFGARWLHISNASKDGIELNPGYDSAQLYMGLMIPF